MKKKLILFMMLMATVSLWSKEFRLSEIAPGYFSCGWKKARINKNVDGTELSIGSEKYSDGVGVHAKSLLTLKLDGHVERFQAKVGVSGGVNSEKASVEFLLVSEKKVLWRSGIMKSGEKPKKVDVKLIGIKQLQLKVSGAGDGIEYDHANWCDAYFSYIGEKPKPVNYLDSLILTPKAPLTPRINGAKIFGVRPSKTFMFQVAATGQRPMIFSALGLPSGISIDRKTGLIKGKIESTEKKTYHIELKAENELGKTSSKFRIVVGDEICLTPPMGWNSWYCHSESISQEEMEKVAQAFVDKGLINHGWTYVNMDDCWQSGKRGRNGAIQPNERFADIKGMCERIHAMGLKVGLYSVPWVSSYAGFIGSSSDCPDGDDSSKYIPLEKRLQPSQVFGRYPGLHRQKVDHIGKYWFGDKDALQWAEWGFDYIKYDWKPNDIPTCKRIVEDLSKCDRDIVLSLSNAAPFEETKNGLKDLANLWRTGGDIHNSWKSVEHRFDSEPKWQKFSRPGHWNDPDMLQVGKSATPNRFNKEFRPSRLTPDEQYSHVTLWTILAAPLLISCDVEDMTDFTLNLLTNDEVIAVNQDALGLAGARKIKTGSSEIWTKLLENGDVAIALFNRGGKAVEIVVDFAKIGVDKELIVRDLWRQQDEGVFVGHYKSKVNSHGTKLITVRKVK